MAGVNMTNVSPKTAQVSDLIWKYMRPENMPHIWCPGCGNGIIMREVAQAVENCGIDRDKLMIVSGIGCSSRAAGYMDALLVDQGGHGPDFVFKDNVGCPMK